MSLAAENARLSHALDAAVSLLGKTRTTVPKNEASAYMWLRGAVRAAIAALRHIAEPAGGTHTWWLTIFELEALMDGKPTTFDWSQGPYGVKPQE